MQNSISPSLSSAIKSKFHYAQITQKNKLQESYFEKCFNTKEEIENELQNIVQFLRQKQQIEQENYELTLYMKKQLLHKLEQFSTSIHQETEKIIQSAVLKSNLLIQLYQKQITFQTKKQTNEYKTEMKLRMMENFQVPDSFKELYHMKLKFEDIRNLAD